MNSNIVLEDDRPNIAAMAFDQEAVSSVVVLHDALVRSSLSWARLRYSFANTPLQAAHAPLRMANLSQEGFVVCIDIVKI